MQIVRTNIVLGLIISLFCSCSNNDNASDDIFNVTKKEVGFVKTLGGTKNESAQSVIKTLDSGYAILGYAQSNDGDVTNKQNDSFDYWLLKYDQNDVLQWQKTYGGSDDDRGQDIIQTSDGGFAILGYSKSNDGNVTENNGFNDFWVSKLDATGSIIWEKSFGFSGTDNGISIIQTNDGGYLLTGVLDVTASNGEGNSKSLSSKRHAGGDYWAIKLNPSGEKQWSRFFGGTFTDTPYDVVQTEDLGYIIVGSSDSDDVDITNNKGSYDFWVIKISSIGDLVWEKSFGGSQTDEARAISKSSDGNYIIVGDTRSHDLDVSNNNGAADLWIIKINPSGGLIWEKTIGGSSFDVGRSISKTQDNGFIISGSSRSTDGDIINNNGQNDAWIVKINDNGNLEWQKTIGGSDIDFAYDAAELNDKSVIVVGESNSPDIDILENRGFTDLLIFKMK
ncbi:hypothetical protein [Flavivirga eckloniae]|uniref:Bulb-type lectin domain-containing protein n=1 Tax=Flavivirga eckloniae TaxID=1803846 RepID=A0A2K9PRX1_9FLAO|nr:hypothetical protein [Flavivirga eckloniae]AUP79814.1 hypothetical protein C1H87_14310 [Flavivirga eckloniae]